MTETYIIVPAYNEGKVIRNTVLSLLGLGYVVVIVDDGSIDLTKDALQDLPVFYIKHLTNLGQGAAISTGVEFAYKKGARSFVTFDADGQHAVSDIAPMLEYLKENKLDIVFGSRFKKGALSNVRSTRKLLLKIGIVFNYVFSGILLSDAHNGLRVSNRKGAKAFLTIENKMAHATEIMINLKRLNLEYGEYPVNIIYTSYSIKKGQSSLGSFKILQDVLLFKIFNR